MLCKPVTLSLDKLLPSGKGTLYHHTFLTGVLLGKQWFYSKLCKIGNCGG